MSTPGLGFFSEYLNDAMTRRRVSAKTLAAQVGCSYEHIRKLTRAEVFCSPELRKNLCRALHLREKRAEELVNLDHARRMGGKNFWESLGKNPRCEPLYIMWPFLTDQQRDMVVASVKYLAGKKREN